MSVHSILKPFQTLCNVALKKKINRPYCYHHCLILQKYSFLSFENVVKYTNICVSLVS